MSKMINLIAPPKSVIGSTHLTFVGNSNNASWLDFDQTSSLDWQHGSKERWRTIMETVTQSTVTTTFDGNFTSYWSYSSTKWTFHNPCNYNIYFTCYEVTPKNEDKAMGNGPIETLYTSALDTDRFPTAALDLNSTIPVSTVVSGKAIYQAGSNATRSFDTSVDIKLSHFKSPWTDEWRVLRKKSYMLRPGQYSSFWQISRYNKFTGCKFCATNPYIPGVTKLLMIRIRTSMQNTSDQGTNAQLSECGYPSPTVAIRVQTRDRVNTFAEDSPKMYYLDNSLLEANKVGYQHPVGTAFTVANIVGESNKEADNE